LTNIKIIVIYTLLVNLIKNHMKKLLLFMAFVLWVFSFNYSNASYTYLNPDKDKNIYKFYKQAVLTRNQIKKDFKDWDVLNKKIEKYFININFAKDRVTKLNDLKKKFEKILENNKSKNLNYKQEKTINLVKNLYYRTVIELKK